MLAAGARTRAWPARARGAPHRAASRRGGPPAGGRRARAPRHAEGAYRRDRGVHRARPRSPAQRVGRLQPGAPVRGAWHRPTCRAAVTGKRAAGSWSCTRWKPCGGRCALRATLPCEAACNVRASTAAPGQGRIRVHYPKHTSCRLSTRMQKGSGSRAQALTIFTVAITWVAMTASIFGQNLYFNIAATPLVRLSPVAACTLDSLIAAALICVKHARSGRGTPRRSHRCSSPLLCWPPCWSMHGGGGCCLFRRPSCDTSACPAFATAGACMSWADVEHSLSQSSLYAVDEQHLAGKGAAHSALPCFRI